MRILGYRGGLYTFTAGIATLEGVTFKHQIRVRGKGRNAAETKALRKLAWRFQGCGIVIEHAQYHG